MVEVGHADAVDPADLVAIARPDPPARRAQVVGRRGRLLGQPLLCQVIRQDHVGPVADVQPVADLDPLAAQRLDLLEQGRRVNHHAVADDAVNPRRGGSRSGPARACTSTRRRRPCARRSPRPDSARRRRAGRRAGRRSSPWPRRPTASPTTHVEPTANLLQLLKSTESATWYGKVTR